MESHRQNLDTDVLGYPSGLRATRKVAAGESRKNDECEQQSPDAQGSLRDHASTSLFPAAAPSFAVTSALFSG